MLHFLQKTPVQNLCNKCSNSLIKIVKPTTHPIAANSQPPPATFNLNTNPYPKNKPKSNNVDGNKSVPISELTKLLIGIFLSGDLDGEYDNEPNRPQLLIRYFHSTNEKLEGAFVRYKLSLPLSTNGQGANGSASIRNGEQLT